MHYLEQSTDQFYKTHKVRTATQPTYKPFLEVIPVCIVHFALQGIPSADFADPSDNCKGKIKQGEIFIEE
jgi:hypothetical protein